MKKRYIVCLASAAAILASAHSYAEDNQFSFGAGVSTFGYTIEGGYRINQDWGVRVPLSTFSYDRDEEVEGIPYQAELSGTSIGAIADYYTGLGGFRVSGGLFISNYDLDGTARGNLEINGVTYTDVSVRAHAEPKNSLMPMLGFGYDHDFGNNWGISADIGATYVGGFDATLEQVPNDGLLAFPGLPINQDDLDAELAEIRNEADSYKILPYAKIGVNYRF